MYFLGKPPNSGPKKGLLGEPSMQKLSFNPLELSVKKNNLPFLPKFFLVKNFKYWHFFMEISKERPK